MLKTHTNAELSKILLGIAETLDMNKTPGAAVFVRLAAERLHQDAHTIAGLIAIILLREEKHTAT